MDASTPPYPPLFTKRHIAVSWALATLVYVALTLSMGRDINWDYLNYHDYLAWITRGDRLDRDFFGGGIQGYQNPLIYLPLEALLSSGGTSVHIGVALALLHSLNALFLLLICRTISTWLPPLQRRVVLPGFLLGAGAPIFLSHLGATFVDPIASVPVLAAVWLFLRSDTPWQLSLSAAVAGIAVGLKLTNVAFAISLGLAIALCHRRPFRTWFVHTSAAAISMAGGLLLTYGWWGWKLFREFGNPFFPLLNGVFKSPLFMPHGGNIVRFIPQTPGDLLAFPFSLLQHNSWIYVEVVAPDLLPAAVAVLASMAGILTLTRWQRGTLSNADISVRGPFRLGVYFALSTLTWMATSANGRYGMTLFALLGPLAAILLTRVVPPRPAYVAAWVMVVLQWFNTYTVGIGRWGAQKWTAQWFQVDIPAEHREKPGAYIALDSQSQSYLVRHLHPESSYVNLIGSHYSIPSDGAGSKRFREILQRHPGRVFAVFKGTGLPGLKPSIGRMTRQKSDLLDRVGLAVNAESCTAARVGGGPLLQDGIIPRLNSSLPPATRTHLYICAAEAVAPSLEMSRRRTAASAIMLTLEKHCPELFYPPGPQTEGVAYQWYRSYTKYDNLIVSVHLDDGSVRYWLTGQGKVKLIGNVRNWPEDLKRFDCQLPEAGRRGVPSITTMHDLGPL